MKLLPIEIFSYNIGIIFLIISDFKKLIERNYVYVDKTVYIYKLIKTGKYYFLRHPRCFGKSLLLSTIRYLFKEMLV